eukprot:TRINITY_DN11380_c0_g1_i1.p1 TRINITY_DN11380_c0_g1~~TRINITY_DN11380_c0_g1_i1.p1  ORF type:complete len:776 (-),score=170.35 TRINITY_DN11380_c0_g1_i1:43-2307(-)
MHTLGSVVLKADSLLWGRSPTPSLAPPLPLQSPTLPHVHLTSLPVPCSSLHLSRVPIAQRRLLHASGRASLRVRAVDGELEQSVEEAEEEEEGEKLTRLQLALRNLKSSQQAVLEAQEAPVQDEAQAAAAAVEVEDQDSTAQKASQRAPVSVSAELVERLEELAASPPQSFRDSMIASHVHFVLLNNYEPDIAELTLKATLHGDYRYVIPRLHWIMWSEMSLEELVFLLMRSHEARSDWQFRYPTAAKILFPRPRFNWILEEMSRRTADELTMERIQELFPVTPVQPQFYAVAKALSECPFAQSHPTELALYLGLLSQEFNGQNCVVEVAILVAAMFKHREFLEILTKSMVSLVPSERLFPHDYVVGLLSYAPYESHKVALSLCTTQIFAKTLDTLLFGKLLSLVKREGESAPLSDTPHLVPLMSVYINYGRTIELRRSRKMVWRTCLSSVESVEALQVILDQYYAHPEYCRELLTEEEGKQLFLKAYYMLSMAGDQKGIGRLKSLALRVKFRLPNYPPAFPPDVNFRELFLQQRATQRDKVALQKEREAAKAERNEKELKRLEKVKLKSKKYRENKKLKLKAMKEEKLKAALEAKEKMEAQIAAVPPSDDLSQLLRSADEPVSDSSSPSPPTHSETPQSTSVESPSTSAPSVNTPAPKKAVASSTPSKKERGDSTSPTSSSKTFSLPAFDKPEKKTNAYRLYSLVNRSKLKQDNPKLAASVVSKMLNENWASVGDIEKGAYQEEAKRLNKLLE